MTSLNAWIAERGIRHQEVELIKKAIETESCGMPRSPTSPDMALIERERDHYYS